ncbi:hypothetical protein CDAR_431141 [Caerostris darwini]|uniref:Uncharacterized protein n=1 Tax=Caerostris darwini TaxID=1538125 RepID=A0AAV4WWN0_9ARAC|nr:hypothetical protein CDAR_431141 [Caerostris darwini]
MKSSIPVLLLLFGWIASFGNCDRSYRIIEKTNNNEKPGKEDEQCMAEIRQACGASECCRKLFQLQKSQGDEKHVSKMEDEYSNTDEIPDGDDDEEENQSGPPSFTNDYPDKRGAFMKADAEGEPGDMNKKKT